MDEIAFKTGNLCFLWQFVGDDEALVASFLAGAFPNGPVGFVGVLVSVPEVPPRARRLEFDGQRVHLHVVDQVYTFPPQDEEDFVETAMQGLARSSPQILTDETLERLLALPVPGPASLSLVRCFASEPLWDRLLEVLPTWTNLRTLDVRWSAAGPDRVDQLLEVLPARVALLRGDDSSGGLDLDPEDREAELLEWEELEVLLSDALDLWIETLSELVHHLNGDEGLLGRLQQASQMTKLDQAFEEVIAVLPELVEPEWEDAEEGTTEWWAFRVMQALEESSTSLVAVVFSGDDYRSVVSWWTSALVSACGMVAHWRGDGYDAPFYHAPAVERLEGSLAVEVSE